MSILIDLVPTSVKIDNKDYEINSNFRTSILFEEMIQDNELDEIDKIKNTLFLYYKEIPSNIEEAIKQAMWFYRCGKKENKRKSKGKSSNEILYDFEYDDEYIYSAFLKEYNIDLQDIEYLHWWKFKALFNSLSKNNKIVEIMGYRAVNLADIKDKEQKKYYKEMKKLYSIPKKHEITQLEKDLNQVLLHGGDLKKLLDE